MGSLTEKIPKSMVALSASETIIGRQVRLLYECGIRDIIITTGAHAQVLRDWVGALPYRELKVSLVHNPLFAETNYIYSFYLASDLVDDDILLLHGDLVFGKELLEAILTDPRTDLAAVDKTLPLPDKDFKARLSEDLISEISVKIFDKDCHSFQPLYKLSKGTAAKWLSEIGKFVQRGMTSVYAEEALNALLADGQIPLQAFLSDGMLINEVDTAEDLNKVSKAAEDTDRQTQRVYSGDGLYEPIQSLVRELGITRPLVVTKTVGERCGFLKELNLRGIRAELFDEFQSNPLWNEAEQGFRKYKEQHCDAVISLGGGSAIDIAKCIAKLAMDECDNENARPPYHIAIPSTAGSGAEATHFAVVYRDGEKCSVSDPYIRPQAVILCPELLETLPLYQKRATYADALCHCVESLWSVKATDSSRAFAFKALEILMSKRDYFETGINGAENVLQASHLAGKAINISQTTAAHAMCYKLTTDFGIPHGHAALLCLWSVAEHWDNLASGKKSDDIRNAEKLIMRGMGTENMKQTANVLRSMIGKLGEPDRTDEAHIDKLTDSVNLQRLGNFPFTLSADEIKMLYAFLLSRDGENSIREY